MYVKKELLPIFRDELIPLADISVPNQFEVELLTGTKRIVTESDVWRSLDWFHERNVKTVVMSSSDIRGSNILMSFLSHLNADNGECERYKITVPRQGDHIGFTGVGDLFAALFLANSSIYAKQLGKALEMSVASLQSVISCTLDGLTADELIRTPDHKKELKIIQCRDKFANPDVKLRAQKVNFDKR